MASTRNVISPGIFAEDASTTIPPTPIQGVSYRDPVAGPASAPDGWPFFEKVNSAEFNQLMYQYSSLVDIMDKQGILGWSDLKDYESAAMVYGSNGLLYFWLQESGPGTAQGVKDPVSEPDYWQQFAQHGSEVFTTAGVTNWSVPLAMQLGIIKPKVTVIGGGGSGARQDAESGSGGGAGGSSVKFSIDLTGVPTVTVTVGSGGVPAGSGLNGGNGGSSSFGSFCSATGGGGALNAGAGEGGSGIGGDLNVDGQGGGAKANGVGAGVFASGQGGSSILGGGGRGRHTSTVQPGLDGKLGAGGSGSILSAVAGAGGAGAVLIEW